MSLDVLTAEDRGIETRRSGGKNPEEDWKEKQEIRELLSKRS